MFERFTADARRTVTLAVEVAEEIGHGYLGAEHLLIALAGTGPSIATEALIDVDSIRAEHGSTSSGSSRRGSPTSATPTPPRFVGSGWIWTRFAEGSKPRSALEHWTGAVGGAAADAGGCAASPSCRRPSRRSSSHCERRSGWAIIGSGRSTCSSGSSG